MDINLLYKHYSCVVLYKRFFVYISKETNKDTFLLLCYLVFSFLDIFWLKHILNLTIAITVIYFIKNKRII